MSSVSIGLPLAAFLVFRCAFRGVVWLAVFIAFSFTFELLFYYTASKGIINIQWSHVYAIVEFVTLYLFMLSVLSTAKNRSLFLLAGGLYTALLVFNPLLFEPWDRFNPVARTSNSLVFLVLGFFFYYKIFREEHTLHLESRPEFWIVTALIFYFSTSFFTFLLSSEIFKSDLDKIETSWFFHSISNIVKNVLLTIGLWTGKR